MSGNIYPLYPTFIWQNWGIQYIPTFLIFAPKHRLWVLIRTASPRRFLRIPTLYMFGAKYHFFFYLKVSHLQPPPPKKKKKKKKNVCILHGHVFIINLNDQSLQRHNFTSVDYESGPRQTNMALRHVTPVVHV